MPGQTNLERRFDDKKREQLAKLFRALGTDNVHEAEAARGRIDSLLREYGRSWRDVTKLLGGATIRADLAHDITALGSSEPDERGNARRNILEVLTRHRKTWNDLVDVLCAHSQEAWACDPLSDDPPRINDLVGLIIFLLEMYVALKPHEYVAVALWVLHTHVYNQFMVTPRLALRSPVPGCGKTTLFDVLTRLIAMPKKFDLITPAALYRLLDEAHPSLLIDEVDNLGLALGQNGRLRAVFNSGHRKGGTGTLMERGHRREFSLFAPLALALPDMFGVLPRTLNERNITIMMERHDGQRRLERFHANHPDPALDAAYTQIRLWCREAELNPDPEMPVRNRWADNWRPLISIADALGCGEQARDAMLAFAREYHEADIKIVLLTSIRKVFNVRGVDRLSSKALLDALHELDETEWCEYRGTRGDQQPHRLKETELASTLREFRIKSLTVWPRNRTAGSKSAKGYRRSQFEDAWRMYCDDAGTASHTSSIRGLRVTGDEAA
jgi:hypothetical protein